MKSYDESRIPEFLSKYRKIAVVGISEKEDRDSYRVASYLLESGYQIIPVNPMLKTWKGIKAYPDLKSIPKDEGVEIIDIFRKSEAVGSIVEEALPLDPKLIWMQETVVNENAADIAKENGVYVVMDRCMMKEHSKMV